MAVKNLQSLVLRGSAVLLVGKAGNPRLGTDSTAKPETPEICISMRHPSRSGEQDFQPAPRPGHADYYRVDSLAVRGAGRSLRCAGVLSRSCSRSALDNARMWVLPGGTSAAIPVLKRCATALAWCRPANRTPTASSWGFGVR
jgi:hypothetical protein